MDVGILSQDHHQQKKFYFTETYKNKIEI
jgi:hypothetical protein